ncbi:MAG: HAD-IG family 5'-nucleotidase [Oligoflexales bacterium]
MSTFKSGLQDNQRIFVNRSLNMANIRAIGFDMDHTLAPYHKEEFEALAFRETLKKFLDAGYPSELANLKFKPKFVTRGLLVDRDRGNILKVDCHKYVKIAFHGMRQLTRQERSKIYNRQSYKAQEFLSVDSFFALSEVQLFSEIIDFMSNHPNLIQKSFREVYDDLRFFIDESHRDGSIKNEVTKHPEKYIRKDKNIATMLIRLIDAGKTIFLLTNSHYDYTDTIMSYVLDHKDDDFNSWKDYWKYIIVASGKPGFFDSQQKFFEIVKNGEFLKTHSGPLQNGGSYYGGNASLFEKLTGLKGDDILYIGDHMYGDIIQSKGLLNWRTMFILEELEDEFPILESCRNEVEKIGEIVHEKENIDEDLQKKRSKLNMSRRQMKTAMQRDDHRKVESLNELCAKIQIEVEEKEKSLLNIRKDIKKLIREREEKHHAVWGDPMKVGLEKSRLADQIRTYACMYTSRVSNLRFYGPYKHYVSRRESLPHETI